MRSSGRLYAYATAILVAFSPINSAVAAQTNQVATLSKANIRIDNFGQVNATYYRGAQPRGRDYTDLAALGIKTVIDLQADGDLNEAQFVQNAGMKFFRIPMTTRVVPTSEKLSQFLSIVNNPANQPVYVHCAGGRHRTGVMTAVYRMTEGGWNADRAFQEMKQYKFGADFLHPEFKEFVYTYRSPIEPGAPVPAEAAVVVAVTAEN